MTAPLLIDKIMAATQASDLFSRMGYVKEYVGYIRQLHPDVCNLSGAEEAVKQLNYFRERMSEMERWEDDAGMVHRRGDEMLVFSGETALMERSLQQYKRLMSFTDSASRHFQQYLPEAMYFEDGRLVAEFQRPIWPLSGQTFAQHHVSWIGSRLLEFTSWLAEQGYCHAGLNPDCLAVVPETHGLVCFSFYHITPLDRPLKTISGRYKSWYPQVVFDEKKALSYVDISLAQRTLLYLLGDASGNGIKLKKTHHQDFIDFMIRPHYDAFDTYDRYRKLLQACFGKPVFHKLE